MNRVFSLFAILRLEKFIKMRSRILLKLPVNNSLSSMSRYIAMHDVIRCSNISTVPPVF